jgi:hypothetical protein
LSFNNWALMLILASIVRHMLLRLVKVMKNWALIRSCWLPT